MDFLLTTVVNALNPVEWDLTLDATGNLVFVTGADAVAQRVRSRLQFFRGEWFLDTRQGVPYFEDILVKNPRRELVVSLLREAILETPGVASITTFSLSIDNATRSASVTFKALTTDGDTVDVGPVLIGAA